MATSNLEVWLSGQRRQFSHEERDPQDVFTPRTSPRSTGR